MPVTQYHTARAGGVFAGRLGPHLRSALVLAFAVLSLGAGPISQEVRQIRNLMILGELDAAHRRLADYLQHNPGDPDAHYEMGRLLLTYDPPRYDEAIEHLDYAVDKEPGNSDFHLWLGRAYGIKMEHSNLLAAALGPVWKLKGSFEKAVELDPKSQSARVDLFQFYLFAPELVGGGRDAAMEQIKALARQDPSSPLLHTAQAIIAIKDGDLSTAVIEFERVAQLWPERAGQTYFQLAFIFLAEGNYAKAESYLRRALDSQTPIEPANKILLPRYVRNAFYEKARYEIEHGVKVAVESSSLSAASRISKRQETRDPRYIRLLRLIGGIYEENGRTRLANLYYQRALDLDGGQAP